MATNGRQKALTRGRSATYHTRMSFIDKGNYVNGLGYALALAALLCGCEEAGKKPVQAHVPGQTPGRPAVRPVEPATVEVGALPPPNLPVGAFISLREPTPSGVDYLIARVQERFAQGEANYKAGHLEAARRDFDDAVDWMLESGYDPNGDPRLSELFHHVTDQVYT